jgi:hypothetical protein
MTTSIRIEDHTIWFKHIDEPKMRERLAKLKDDEEINLDVDGVVGRWKRMRTGRDGRPTNAIRPEGAMKAVWNEWFKTRKGEIIELREARLADDYLAANSALFSEWSSPEDEEAFRDL